MSQFDVDAQAALRHIQMSHHAETAQLRQRIKELEDLIVQNNCELMNASLDAHIIPIKTKHVEFTNGLTPVSEGVAKSE